MTYPPLFVSDLILLETRQS